MNTCTRSTRADISLLLIRIGVGTIFIAHALLYLQVGVNSLATLLGGTLGFPAPNLFAWLTIFVELFGGIALVLGVATPVAATLLSILSVIAILTLKAKLGLVAKVGVGAELDIALLVGTVSIALQGAGWYSLDRRLGWFRCSCDCCARHPEKKRRQMIGEDVKDIA